VSTRVPLSIHAKFQEDLRVLSGLKSRTHTHTHRHTHTDRQTLELQRNSFIYIDVKREKRITMECNKPLLLLSDSSIDLAFFFLLQRIVL
jgi:hypothetical protein